MSEVSFSQDASVASKEPTAVSSTTLVHSTGTVSDTGPAVMSESFSKAVYNQKTPSNPLGDFLCRYTKIFDATMQNTDAIGFENAAFDPWQLFLANPFIAEKAANFSLIRATLEVVAVVALPGNCYGTYVLSACPNGGTAPTGPNAFEVGAVLPWEACMQVDHYARLSCSEAENLVLQLPFLWPYDFAQLPNGPVNSWRVHLFCLSALKTAIPGGVQIGTVSFYARCMEDLEMCVPVLQGHMAKGKIDMHPMLRKIAPKLADKIQPGAVSGAMGEISKMADMAANIPIIGGYAKAASHVADTIGGIASFFGFTKEAAPHAPTNMAIKSFSSISNVDGSDSSEIAALSQANSISIDPNVGGGIVGAADCLATADLFSRWTHLASFTWSPTDAVGDDLLSLDVAPSRVSQAFSFVPNTACWFGMPFAYWRGDMEYLVVLPVSKIHRGSVQAFWVPFGSTSTGSDPTNVTLNAIAGVGSDDETVYRVGFARDRPFCHNEIIHPSGIINTSWANGTIVFRVVNPLVSQNSSASVTGHVFVRAGSNMEFAYPRQSYFYNDNFTSGYRSIRTLVYEGKEDETPDKKTVSLVQSSGEYPLDDVLFGERILSVRPLLQKFCRVGLINDTDSINTVGYMPQLGPLPKVVAGSASADVTNYWSYQGWYRAAFTGIATSERMKLLNPTNTTFITMFAHRIDGTGVYKSGIDLADTASLSAGGPAYAHEVTIPYYVPLKYQLGRVNFGQIPGVTANAENRGIYYAGINSSNSGASQVCALHAFGPDIRVTNFRFTPKVNFIEQDWVSKPIFWNTA